jgi:hypothetical protein
LTEGAPMLEPLAVLKNKQIGWHGQMKIKYQSITYLRTIYLQYYYNWVNDISLTLLQSDHIKSLPL